MSAFNRIGPALPGDHADAVSANPALPSVLPGLEPGGSLERVLQKRLEQQRLGYTAEADANLPIGFLLHRAQAYATDAHDWLQRGHNQDPQRKHFEGKLVNAAALILAELDRLNFRRSLEGTQS